MLAELSQTPVIISAFRTVLYFESGNLFHAELDARPEACMVRLVGNALFPLTAGAQGSIAFDDLMHPGGAGRLAFFKKGKFLTARPDGSVEFSAKKIGTWEKFDALPIEQVRRMSWRPAESRGGTPLVRAGLNNIMGSQLDRIELHLNAGGHGMPKARPRINWVHNDIGPEFDRFQDPAMVEQIDKFVFVSEWQRLRFIEKYQLPPQKCCVIHNAVEPQSPGAQWASARPWRLRCAYISAPYRGLETLIKAWRGIDPDDAELHIWSGTRLWGKRREDSGYYHLFAKAADTRNVFYHGIAPNEVIREALRDMHFLTMPSNFLETFCISAVEAMASGCRVVAPAIGALPEVVGGFGRLYQPEANQEKHAEIFGEILRDEFRLPWQGDRGIFPRQIAYVAENFSWEVIAADWRKLISDVTPSLEMNFL